MLTHQQKVADVCEVERCKSQEVKLQRSTAKVLIWSDEVTI